jgi:hypothetical protein
MVVDSLVFITARLTYHKVLKLGAVSKVRDCGFVYIYGLGFCFPLQRITNQYWSVILCRTRFAGWLCEGAQR